MADIGVIGLAVMGQNLILNMRDKGLKVDEFVLSDAVSKVVDGVGGKIIPSHSLEEFVDAFDEHKPRLVLLMVKAGRPVDDFIEALVPHLKRGDCIIDGGNSLYEDTKRRCEEMELKSMLFVGCGVSGGEEGARYGPSLMPGGSPSAWPLLKSMFQAIAAQANGKPCCQWLGPSGSGHFVKMVHNGIEYGDMQMISEIYDVFVRGLKIEHGRISKIFSGWAKSESPLCSFLIEITADILAFSDADGTPLVTKIKDTAGQKGTGKWTVSVALDLGVPGTLTSEAVFARCLSSRKKEREAAACVLKGPEHDADFSDQDAWIDALRDALVAAKIISYAQGFSLIAEASSCFGWDLKYADIAQVWQGGCIIRSSLLGNIQEAFKDGSDGSILMHPWFVEQFAANQQGLRKVVAQCAFGGIPVPTLGAALSYYDGLRSKILPANLIQAQRDYFGAHGYERIDQEGIIHTNWTGRGGSTSSSNYQV